MKKYDLECLFSDIEALLVQNLNTKITAINAEKNDGITLKSVDNAAYFLQELNGKQINFNPFILYGLETSNSESIRGHSIEDVTISVIIVIEDQGEDTKISPRMLRYRRCLKEVFEDNFQIISNSNTIKIQSLVPVAFQTLNSSESYRAVGVNIKTVIDS